MLSNACLLAKFRFDTAENEPAKNLQKFAKKMLILLSLPTTPGTPAAGAARRPAERAQLSSPPGAPTSRGTRYSTSLARPPAQKSGVRSDTARSGKLDRARSRLYRGQIL